MLLREDGGFVCPAGTLSKREVDQAMVQFRAFDTDGDGVVSYADFRAAMIKHNPAMGAADKQVELQRRFRDADIDGNGMSQKMALSARWAASASSTAVSRQQSQDSHLDSMRARGLRRALGHPQVVTAARAIAQALKLRDLRYLE